MIEQKADYIYTMLNAGRTGAIEACREKGVKQLGNVRDWVAAMPDVFVGSAVADSSIAFFDAVRDYARGSFKPGTIQRIGLGDPQAVRLVLADGVAPDIKARIAAWREDIIAGRIKLPENYSGPEFTA